jgi:hypothetical protein
MWAIRYSSMVMPLSAITIFLTTELVFATFGVRRPACVTVTTGNTLGPGTGCGQVNTR